MTAWNRGSEAIALNAGYVLPQQLSVVDIVIHA
jgi:hypothetical protein